MQESKSHCQNTAISLRWDNKTQKNRMETVSKGGSQETTLNQLPALYRNIQYELYCRNGFHREKPQETKPMPEARSEAATLAKTILT